MKAKVILLIATAFSILIVVKGQTQYKMKPTVIKTRWANDVSPSNSLIEYPRPQMVRSTWINLNGLWDYSISTVNEVPASISEGKILVPYPIESALSGVKKALKPDQNLWYKRIFRTPKLLPGEHLLLHFGAVDWQTTIMVNGKEVGQHTGGYTEFSFDITAYLKGENNELLVKVYDPTDFGIGPHGKQVLNPANIYYTPTSGIWQTVWMETVPEAYITDLKFTPDIDKGELKIKVNLDGKNGGYSVNAIAMEGNKEISSANSQFRNDGKEDNLTLKVPNGKLWSPGSPFLYDLVVRVKRDGKVVDEVKSYFGMRKISIGKDEKGVDRIFLNNTPYYNLGTLDQGFWPDGLYTAPTDEALAFDVKAIKAMGFNTIRKHIKVEPARWYYWTDKLGMLVWQDFVNPNQALPDGSKEQFEKGAKEELEQLHNHPSIVTWVLFNEKWGQYDQQRLSEWVKNTDPSRILNGHSGEMLFVDEQLRSPSPDAYVSADMTDVHSYPDPMISIKQPGKAQVCGEFGGIGVFIPLHQWLTGSAWGYIQEKPAALKAKYTIMNQHLQLMQKEGLSGSIYTQPFDVEGEQNGLMTYDREVIKIPFVDLRQIHASLNPEMGKIPSVTANDADITEPGLLYSKLLEEYIEGKRDPEFLKKMTILASQAGDKLGVELAGAAYISSLKVPLSDEDIQTTIQFTKSTKDPGYQIMTNNPEIFKKAMGDRKYTFALMTMIMKGEIEPILAASDKPDWDVIAQKISPFGTPGAEMLLRAKTITSFNKKDWSIFVPAAKEYISKYGTNIKEDEKRIFSEEIEKH